MNARALPVLVVAVLVSTSARAGAQIDPASAASEAEAAADPAAPPIPAPPPSSGDEGDEGSFDPATVARDSERVEAEVPDVDLALTEGNARARRYDDRRKLVTRMGLFQGALVIVLMPRAVRTLRDGSDPVVRGVTSAWIAVGTAIVSATSIVGAHASIAESRLYRCGGRRTSRRAGRAALALGAIPGLSLVSPLFSFRQHQVNERARECELAESLRTRRYRITVHDEPDETSEEEATEAP